MSTLNKKFQKDIINLSDLYFAKQLDLFMSFKSFDINFKDDFGLTNLMLCAKNKNKFKTKLLIEKGASLNEQDTFGNTFLIYSTTFMDLSFLNYLKEITDLDFNKQNTQGNTLLHILVKFKNIDLKLVQVLLDKVDLNLLNQEQLTVLDYYVIFHRNTICLETLKNMIEHKANIFRDLHPEVLNSYPFLKQLDDFVEKKLNSFYFLKKHQRKEILQWLEKRKTLEKLSLI